MTKEKPGLVKGLTLAGLIACAIGFPFLGRTLNNYDNCLDTLRSRQAIRMRLEEDCYTFDKISRKIRNNCPQCENTDYRDITSLLRELNPNVDPGRMQIGMDVNIPDYKK